MAAPTDYVPAKNSTTEVIPAGGIVRVAGIDTDTGAFLVDKPDVDGSGYVAVVGMALIPAEGFGQIHFDPRAIAAYDRADGTPAPGESWGARAGSWLLRKGELGFVILDGFGIGLVNVVRLGGVTNEFVAASITSSTLLPCPVIDNGCCILFPECGTVYDCKGRPIERSAVDFATICAVGIEGVSTTVPSNCGDRVVHCGNTESACLPRCDYPATDDVLTDAGDAGDCCTPSVGSVMESSPHAGECGFWPPCVVIAGGNGTGTLAGVAFGTAANVNYDAEWPFAYTAPGGNFYITGRLVLCLESPFPGWYFAGRVYVYNPAGNSGSGDTDECGCDTVFGACPTAADDASQEIVAFHLGDKTETLRLTTACGTLDLTIAPCDTPDVPDPVEYACVAGPTGNICTPTVGGPYLNDPTCGGKCDEADPDPDPVPEPCCDGAGDPLEGHPDMMLYPFNLFVGSPSSLGPFVWDGTAYVYGDFTHPHTGTVYTNARIICDAGVWYARSSQPEKVAIAASCTPFGVVFEDAFGLGQTANAVIA